MLRELLTNKGFRRYKPLRIARCMSLSKAHIRAMFSRWKGGLMEMRIQHYGFKGDTVKTFIQGGKTTSREKGGILW